MAELVEKQDRLLARVIRSQRPMAIAGALLALLGIAYMAWGVARFNPRLDPRDNPGFDWPVARIAFLFESGRIALNEVVPETRTEARLLRGLTRNMNFSTGLMVLLVRIVFGTLAMMTGFAIMTVVVERARLLAMIQKLRE
jgi:hypothetical protein